MVDEPLTIPIQITEKEYLQSLARMEASTIRAARSAERGAGRSFSGINKNLKRTTSGFKELNTVSRRSFGNLRMTSMQLSQVAQQGAITGDYMRALAFQLPDLALGFGTLGIAIGAVAGIAATFALDLIDTGSASEEMAEAAEALTKAVNEYSSAAQDASVSTVELAEKYGTATDAARTFLIAAEQAAKVRAGEALTESLQTLTKGFQDFGQGLGITFEDAGRQIDALEQEYQEIQKTLQTGSAEQRAQARDEERAFQARYRDLLAYQDALGDLTNAFGISFEEAGRLADAMTEVGVAEGPKQQAETAQQLLQTFIAIVGNYEDMTFAQREYADALIAAGADATRLQGEIEKAGSATVSLVEALDNAKAAFPGLVDLAGDLWENMRGAAMSAGEILTRAASIAQYNQFRSAGGLDAVVNDVRDTFTPSGLRRDDIVLQRTFNSGGGGRSAPSAPSGGGRELEPFFADIENQITDLERLSQTIGKSAGEVAELEAKWALLDLAQERNITVTSELEAAIDGQAAKVRELVEANEAAEKSIEDLDAKQRVLDDILVNASNQITDGLIDAASGAESLKDAFGRMAASILSDLGRLIVQQTIYNALAGALGGTQIDALNPAQLITGAYAGGTNYAPGGVALVGENGPELVNLPRGSQVIPAPETATIMRNGSGGGGGGSQAAPVVHVHNTIIDDPRKIGREWSNSPEGERDIMAVVNRNR